jgi:hypothetical protein
VKLNILPVFFYSNPFDERTRVIYLKHSNLGLFIDD